MKTPNFFLFISVVLLPLMARSQQQPLLPARSQFEVALLKPDPECESVPRGGGSLSPSPGRLEMPCVTLANLIQTAYGTFGDGTRINTQALPMEGGPSWMQSEHYSLSAKADGPARTETLAGPMLQTFLEERFRLQTHREMRELPVYAMTIGKRGLKLQPLAEGACLPLDLTHPPVPPKPGDPRPNLCGIMILGKTENGETTIEVRGATMTEFAQRLSGRLDRPVVNKTGIPGKFNFHLEFTPDTSIGQNIFESRADLDNAGAPNIFLSLEERIGLKLVPDRGPVSSLFIDHVEKPAAN